MASKAVNQFKLRNDNDPNRKGSQSGTRDETDLAASRQSFYSSENIGRKSTVCDAFFAFGSMGTFTADIISDLIVSYQYYDRGEYWWFALTLSFVLLASVTMQIFSAKWFHEDGKSKSWLYYLMHFLHLGPLVRYWRAFREGWKTRLLDAEPNQYEIFLAEWRDISMLRLFEAFLESAPQLVLQLYIMSYRRIFNLESDWFTAVAAVCSLVSLAWAIVSYSKALRDLQANKGSLSWFGFGFQIVWRLCMVASRVVALVVFASIYSYYLFVAVGVHWLIMTLWLISQKTKFCTDDEGGEHPFKEKLFSFIIGFIYIFCFFNTKEGMTRKRLFLYYSIMLVENSLFVSIWFPQRSIPGAVAMAAISIVWGGFVVGIVSMVMYYKFYHPSLPGTGIFFQRMEFDVEGHRVYSVVCCFCCRIQSSDTSGATCGTVVNWCRRTDDPFLVARGHSYRRSPRNRPPTPRHEPQSSYPPFELEFMPRQISREYPGDMARNRNSWYSEREPHRHGDAHLEQGFDPAVIGPGYNLHPFSNGSCPQNIPNIVVTASSPDVLSPRDSISEPALNANCGSDLEPSSDDEEVPMLVDPTKIMNGQAADVPDGPRFIPEVEKSNPDVPCSAEVHDAINRILHRDVDTEEGTFEEDGEDIRPINYGTLSFGKRYSLVSDCISLSSDSRSSDSLHSNEEVNNDSKHECDSVRTSDHGECAVSVVNKDNSILEPLPASSSEELNEDSLSNFKDVKSRIRKRTRSSDLEPAVHTLNEGGRCIVKSIMDEAPSPCGTVYRSKESSLDQMTLTSKKRDEGLNIEQYSSESISSRVSAEKSRDSWTGVSRNPFRRSIEFMSDEESSLQSPITENSKLKRHTFDFSEISKERPNRKIERHRRRTRRKDFGNFVITSIKPGKFGSIRRSSERLYKIQEASEEGIGINSHASSHIKDKYSISEDKTNDLRINLLTTNEDDNDSDENQGGTNSEPQSPSDMKKIKEEYAKKRRLKRLLTKQLAPGKFSTVRRSYDRIPFSDDDLCPERKRNTVNFPSGKDFTEKLENEGIISGDSAISNMNETSTSSPDVEDDDHKNVSNLTSSVSRRHTFDFSYITIPNKFQDGCNIDKVNTNCLANPPSPLWRIKGPSVTYRNRRPTSIHGVCTQQSVEEIVA